MEQNHIYLKKKYLSIYKNNPQSRVFARLAHLYRKEGQLEKALALCKKGVSEQAHFAEGHIALALVLMDMNRLEKSLSAIKAAIKLEPKNIFAYQILGQIQLALKNPEQTIRAYKMVLLLEPENKTAQNLLKKLEPVTAIQYDKTGFAFKSLKEVAQHITEEKGLGGDKTSTLFSTQQSNLESPKQIEQFEIRYSILSALIYRKEFLKARTFLKEIKNLYGEHTYTKDRLQALEQKLFSLKDEEKAYRKQKTIQQLRGILQQIEKLQTLENTKPLLFKEIKNDKHKSL